MKLNSIIQEKIIKACGKVIITGEHSVLRGGLAIAYPLYNKFLEIAILSPKQTKNNKNFQPIDQNTLQRALEICGKSLPDLKAKIWIKNSLSGGGLGSSAALCVALGRLMISQGWLSTSDLFKYCHTLEHTFHGESSGLDIAVILKETPISYKKEEGAKALSINWFPQFYLSFSGQKSFTAQNIKQVQKQKTKDIDQKMSHASQLTIKALQKNAKEGLPLLIEALQIAHSCFQQWSLVPDALTKHIEQCQKDGAFASKPTGSGGGGYVLSLFNQPPSQPTYIPAPLKITDT